MSQPFLRSFVVILFLSDFPYDVCFVCVAVGEDAAGHNEAEDCSYLELFEDDVLKLGIASRYAGLKLQQYQVDLRHPPD